MSGTFTTEKVALQFLYPFRIARWDTLRHGLGSFIEEFSSTLYTDLERVQQGLEDRLGPYAPKIFDSATGVVGKPGSLDRRRVASGDSDASILAALRGHIRRDQSMANHAFQLTDDPVSYELLELIRRADCRRSESVMRYLCERVNASGLPLVRPAEYHPGDDRGTRGYLERKQPHLEARISASSVSILNPEALTDVAPKLPAGEPDDGRVTVRITPLIRIMSSGFGCLEFKIRLSTEQGLLERVDEVAFTAESVRGIDPASALASRVALAQDLRAVIGEAVRQRSTDVIQQVLDSYADTLHVSSLFVPLQSLVDGVTVVSAPLVADDIIDVANVDRGSARGSEPRLEWVWGELSRIGTMWDYFRHVAENVVLSRLARSILADERLAAFIGRRERRADRADQFGGSRNEILSAMSGLVLDSSAATLEEHPYVCTFISAPAEYKEGSSAGLAAAIEHFDGIIEAHRKDLTQILMKSKWAGIRSDWSRTAHAFDNLFYSDLIYMAVDIRSTLCLYYAPSNAEEYQMIPELTKGYKYLDELSDTLQDQRILWYAYTSYESLVSEDIRSIATALEDMKEDALQERFAEVIEGLTEIVNGIDRKKIALAEMMHDPMSRKGGSSLFAALLSRTSEVFQLEALYHNLESKMERLDMLGIHVAENVQQYSSLVVQEGTRSAQFTLEFLEAFIIGFYCAELAELSLPEQLRETVYVMSQWWTFYVVSLGVFLTALPIITLIRRGRSRFTFDNPRWLEALERIGIVVGPAILAALIFFGVSYRQVPGTEEFAWSAHTLQYAVLSILGYAAVVLGYRRIERSEERERGYRKWWQFAWLGLHR